MTAVAAIETKPRVILIDLSSLFWTAWHATGDQDVSRAQHITLENVKRCVGQNDDALVAICCDSGRSFRKDLLPAYKANRPEKDHATVGELVRVKARLRADGYLLWEADGFEADDIIATNCHAAVSLGHDVLIASADKDLLQLVGPGVRALRTHTWVEGGEADVIEKFGVAPGQLGDWLALVGDKSDNIQGAAGIGPKRATDLLKEHSNLAGIFYVAETVPSAFTPSIRKSLKENEDAVLLARRLVQLRTDAPINFMDIYVKRSPQKLTEVEMEQEEIPISRGPGRTPPAEEPRRRDAPADPAAPETVPTPLPDLSAAVAVDPQPAHRLVETQTGEAMFEQLLKQRGFSPVEYDKALEPRDTTGAVNLAKHLFNSRVYTKFPTWESILATILRGRSMGIPSTVALDVFHIVEGRPYPFAYLIIALAQKDPDCEYLFCSEADSTHALWETKNRKNPRPQQCVFTLEQARIADLPKVGAKGGNGWHKNPEDMLVKSAGAKLARRVYPGPTLGLTSLEEMGEA